MKNLHCFQHVKWNPDRAELRSFAIAMLVGFGILGAIAAVRGGAIVDASKLLWSAGAILAICAPIPGLGRAAYLAVYLPASVMGWIVSHVLLTVVFYGPFTIIGALMRLTGTDSLMLRLAPGETAWRPAKPPGAEQSYYRQF